MPKYIILTLLMVLFTSSRLMAEDYLDSLKNELVVQQSKQNVNAIGDIYKQIGNFYFKKNNYDLAIKYFQESLETVLYASSNIPSVIAETHLNLGYTHNQLSNFSEAIYHYKKAVEIGEFDEDAYQTVGRSLGGIGNLYVDIGDYEQAYSYHLKAMKLNTAHLDSSGMGRSYYTMGSIYFHQRQLDEALNYYKKSLNMWIHKGNKRWIYTCNDAIGVVYGEKKQYDKWLEYSELALENAEEADYLIGIAYGTHNLASYYHDMHCFEEASMYYNEALQKMQAAKDKVGEVKVLRAIAKFYIEQEAYDKALVYLEQGLEIAQPIGARPLIKEIYQLLYQSFHKLGQLRLAHNYQAKYLSLNDSLIIDNNTERILAMQIRHELQKKEVTIAELQQEQEVKQLYPKASLIGIAILLLFVFLLFNRHHLVQIEHQLLAKKKAKSEKERAILATSNRSLEYFATVAYNDLQKPLQHIDQLVSSLQVEYQENLTEDSRDFIYYISDGIERMSNLLTDLLSYARLDSRKTAWKLTNVNVHTLVDEVQRSLINMIEEKDAQIIIESLPHQIVANQTTLIQLFQNLISNGLKFVGDKSPVIRINCVVKKDQYLFSIQDNGIGIAAEHQSRIFEIFKRLHTSKEYKGTGIGLATCQKIVRRHGGEIFLTSELGYGTTFYFTIDRKLQISSANTQIMIQKAA
ncbi:MAG: tetratricopeptide repeat protein [Chitinophagales bacterium]